MVTCPGYRSAKPSSPAAAVSSRNAANPRGHNGVFYFSPQQSRLDIETRTPTAWGESRTFFAFDWAGVRRQFHLPSVQQAGGDSLFPRLRFAYGTLGEFLGGQALSNFSDADADTELMDFGGAIGRPAASASRSCATPLPVRMAAPSRCRPNNRSPASSCRPARSPMTTEPSRAETAIRPAGPVVPSTSFCNGVPCTGSGITACDPTSQPGPDQGEPHPDRRLLLVAALGAYRLFHHSDAELCQ